MHAAFEDENAGPDFAPEPFTSHDGQKLYQDLLSQADIAFEALRRKQAILTGAAAEAAHQVLRLEPEITTRFGALRESSISAVRIRHHGDYHLGQVLYTGSDFMIIDFEGEPARPLSERRRKALAMRDVAGMLRSFQYAAYAALFDSKGSGSLESWADFWTQQVSAIYLEAYFSTARGLRCIPSSAAEQHVLLDAFLLQKALYELAYELNNRPDWVLIPLRGILSLMNSNRSNGTARVSKR
jgi:maltose alpha-D-glucosyltransferase/alpha-amylase